MIDEKLLVLLGLGVAGIMVTAAACQNDTDEDFYEDGEGYYNTGVSNDTIINYELPKQKQKNVSPLEFGSMVGGNIKEQFSSADENPYANGDYIEVGDYSKNPDKIQVYNASNDTVSLPVGDMTDVGAAESNKYVYDRTIGTIGFTSTKIGSRQRDGADKIRGDLPIIPNKTGWFQTAADPSTDLLLGAMNVDNGIAEVSKPSSIAIIPTTGKSGVAHSIGGKKEGTYTTLDDLRDSSSSSQRPSGVLQAMNTQRPLQPSQLPTVKELQAAAINQKIIENQELGQGTLYVSTK